MVSLKNLKLLARGGQAEIYEYGEGRVLRVLRGPQDEELLKNEIGIMQSLAGTPVHVPGVYEFLTVEGRPAAVVERIAGESMMDHIQRHPFEMRREAESLASLHLELAKYGAVLGLRPSKERARYLVNRAEALEPDLREFVLGLLESLPEGSELCHGDFHPGNIIKADGRNYVIDWFGAYKGDIISDAAHTYLLFKNVPRYPGLSPLRHAAVKFAGNLLAGTYLTAIRKSRAFDQGQFSKWIAVKAAERACFGSPGERQALIRFLTACKKKSTAPETWYRML
jgi:aminoglycoside phosphotransferase (APT) family kinase protein